MYISDNIYSHNLVAKLRYIDRASGLIAGRTVDKSWEKSARFATRCHSITDALFLDGIEVPFLSVKRILEGESTPNDIRYTQDVLNYNQALSYIDIFRDSDDAISESGIREMNRMCLQGMNRADQQRGYYRTIQSWVINSQRNEIIYTPPSPEKVPNLMRKLVDWMNSEAVDGIHPIITAGLFHHWFLAINPFVFANVRVAFLVSRLILLRADYDLKGWGWFEGFFRDNIELYYSKLFSEPGLHQKSNEVPLKWLEYFAEGLGYAYKSTLAHSEEYAFQSMTIIPQKNLFQADYLHRSEPVISTEEHRIELNERQRRILELAQRYNSFHRRDVISEIDLTSQYSPKTISRDLNALVKAGLLVRGGDRKGVYYSLVREKFRQL